MPQVTAVDGPFGTHTVQWRIPDGYHYSGSQAKTITTERQRPQQNRGLTRLCPG
jgi:hypothetical protein